MFFAPHPWNFILSLQSWFWQRVMIFCHPPRTRSALALIWAEFKFDKCPLDTMWLVPCAPDCRTLIANAICQIVSFFIFYHISFNYVIEFKSCKAKATMLRLNPTQSVTKNIFIFFIIHSAFHPKCNASSVARYNQAPVSDNWILYCAAHVEWRRYFIDNCATLEFACLVIFNVSPGTCSHSELCQVNMSGDQGQLSGRGASSLNNQRGTLPTLPCHLLPGSRDWEI